MALEALLVLLNPEVRRHLNTGPSCASPLVASPTIAHSNQPVHYCNKYTIAQYCPIRLGEVIGAHIDPLTPSHLS